jgi:hypothetical protein
MVNNAAMTFAFLGKEYPPALRGRNAEQRPLPLCPAGVKVATSKTLDLHQIETSELRNSNPILFRPRGTRTPAGPAAAGVVEAMAR